MRLIRLGPTGEERPYLLIGEDRVIDVGDQVGDFDSRFFAGGGLEQLRGVLATQASSAVALPRMRFGAPVARPGKVVCIGLNYPDHAAESGAPLPTEPVVFLKAPDTVVGPEDEVRIPRGSTKTDWEVELGVVIGRAGRYLDSAGRRAGVGRRLRGQP